MKNYKLTIDGTVFDVCVNSITEGKADITVDGKPYEVNIEAVQETKPEANAFEPVSREATAQTGSSSTVVSPLPGIVVEICVQLGQEVKSGQKVATIEAMKMENDILAQSSGKVLKIAVNKGDSVLEGTEIIIIG